MLLQSLRLHNIVVYSGYQKIPSTQTCSAFSAACSHLDPDPDMGAGGFWNSKGWVFWGLCSPLGTKTPKCPTLETKSAAHLALGKRGNVIYMLTIFSEIHRALAKTCRLSRGSNHIVPKVSQAHSPHTQLKFKQRYLSCPVAMEKKGASKNERKNNGAPLGNWDINYRGILGVAQNSRARVTQVLLFGSIYQVPFGYIYLSHGHFRKKPEPPEEHPGNRFSIHRLDRLLTRCG